MFFIFLSIKIQIFFPNQQTLNRIAFLVFIINNSKMKQQRNVRVPGKIMKNKRKTDQTYDGPKIQNRLVESIIRSSNDNIEEKYCQQLEPCKLQGLKIGKFFINDLDLCQSQRIPTFQSLYQDKSNLYSSKNNSSSQTSQHSKLAKLDLSQITYVNQYTQTISRDSELQKLYSQMKKAQIFEQKCKNNGHLQAIPEQYLQQSKRSKYTLIDRLKQSDSLYSSCKNNCMASLVSFGKTDSRFLISSQPKNQIIQEKISLSNERRNTAKIENVDTLKIKGKNIGSIQEQCENGHASYSTVQLEDSICLKQTNPDIFGSRVYLQKQEQERIQKIAQRYFIEKAIELIGDYQNKDQIHIFLSNLYPRIFGTKIYLLEDEQERILRIAQEYFKEKARRQKLSHNYDNMGVQKSKRQQTYCHVGEGRSQQFNKMKIAQQQRKAQYEKYNKNYQSLLEKLGLPK